MTFSGQWQAGRDMNALSPASSAESGLDILTGDTIFNVTGTDETTKYIFYGVLAVLVFSILKRGKK